MSQEKLNLIALDENTPFEALWEMFQDESIDEYIREHAYYNYWKRKINEVSMFPLSELRELLKFRRWEHPLGEIIKQLCSQQKIDQQALPTLLSVLDKGSFAWRQAKALSIILDTSLSWDVKLTGILDLKVWWAVREVLQMVNLNQDEIRLAYQIIESKMVPKRKRNSLLQALGIKRST